MLSCAARRDKKATDRLLGVRLAADVPGIVWTDSGRLLVDDLTRLFGRGGRGIRVDLAAVKFIDACGIGSCVKLQQQARECGSDLMFTNPQGIVARVIDVLGLESALLGAGPRG